MNKVPFVFKVEFADSSKDIIVQKNISRSCTSVKRVLGNLLAKHRGCNKVRVVSGWGPEWEAQQ